MMLLEPVQQHPGSDVREFQKNEISHRRFHNLRHPPLNILQHVGLLTQDVTFWEFFEPSEEVCLPHTPTPPSSLGIGRVKLTWLTACINNISAYLQVTKSSSWFTTIFQANDIFHTIRKPSLRSFKTLNTADNSAPSLMDTGTHQINSSQFSSFCVSNARSIDNQPILVYIRDRSRDGRIDL